jgi:hypothetical protein
MRKALLLIMIVLFGMATAHAEEYTYLTIVEQDGTKTSMTAVGLSLSFNSESLTVSNAYTGESKVIALNSLVSMNFSNADETTGIETMDNGQWIMDNYVYDLQGQQVPKGRRLVKGIYIIRKGNENRKLLVR